MKKISIITLSVVAGFAVLASAQTAEELKIKQRSAFRGPVTMRNPFLPLGWQKPVTGVPDARPGAAATPPPEVVLKPDLFTVTSISTGALPVAVINGKIYAEGDLVPFNVGGPRPASAQVFAIKDGSVTLRYQNKTVTVVQKGLR